MCAKNKVFSMKHRHTGIVVKDIQKQLEFYVGLLGLKIYYSQTERGEFLDSILGRSGCEPEIYKLGFDGVTIVELLHFKDIGFGDAKNKSLMCFGITHLAITVDDINSVYCALKSAGVEFTCSPKTSDDGACKVCFCNDFEGNFIELVEEIGHL
jgi:catechol 2,3-dioxygenase-like lactoylglutathione lyase family enzyme